MTDLLRRIGWVILAALAVFLVTVPAAAQESSEGDSVRWNFYAGAFDIIDSDKAIEAGFEHRFEPFTLWRQTFVPMAGIAATDEESVWAYAGLRWELSLGRWVVAPNFAASLYEDGDGKDLGGVIEFRSGLEVARRLQNGSRVGLLFYHLSNARIYELNPGSESLVLSWSW